MLCSNPSYPISSENSGYSDEVILTNAVSLSFIGFFLNTAHPAKRREHNAINRIAKMYLFVNKFIYTFDLTALMMKNKNPIANKRRYKGIELI
jgi:hypothetical protein